MEVQRKGRGHNAGNTNICFDCQNACGGCSWTEINPDTKRPRFEPVPGWTAKQVLLNIGRSPAGIVVVETYHVTKCPQFIPDVPRKGDTRQLSEQQSKEFIENLTTYLRRWNNGRY